MKCTSKLQSKFLSRYNETFSEMSNVHSIIPALLLTFSAGGDETRVGPDGEVKVKTQMKAACRRAAPAFIAKQDASGSSGRAKGRAEFSGGAIATP